MLVINFAKGLSACHQKTFKMIWSQIWMKFSNTTRSITCRDRNWRFPWNLRLPRFSSSSTETGVNTAFPVEHITKYLRGTNTFGFSWQVWQCWKWIWNELRVQQGMMEGKPWWINCVMVIIRRILRHKANKVNRFWK